MARTWFRVRVDLLGGLGARLRPSPGRIFIAGPSHTFLGLADAIDAAFARWDLSHLHEFDQWDHSKARLDVLMLDRAGLLVIAELNGSSRRVVGWQAGGMGATDSSDG